MGVHVFSVLFTNKWCLCGYCVVPQEWNMQWWWGFFFQPTFCKTLNLWSPPIQPCFGVWWHTCFSLLTLSWNHITGYIPQTVIMNQIKHKINIYTKCKNDYIYWLYRNKNLSQLTHTKNCKKRWQHRLNMNSLIDLIVQFTSLKKMTSLLQLLSRKCENSLRCTFSCYCFWRPNDITLITKNRSLKNVTKRDTHAHTQKKKHPNLTYIYMNRPWSKSRSSLV